MKKLLCALLMILLPITAAAETDILYFYENLCESCDPVREFAESFELLTGSPLSSYSFEGQNVFHSAGKTLFDAFCDENKINERERVLPMLVWNGTIYAGTEAIEYDLPKDCLREPGATDSVVWLVSCEACADCAAAEDFLASLPEAWSLTRGTYAFESVLRIETKKAQEAEIRMLMEAFGLTDSPDTAPCVFLGDRYYYGLDDILANVERSIRVGAAVGGVSIPGQ